MNINDAETESYEDQKQRLNILSWTSTPAIWTLNDTEVESYAGDPIGKNRIFL